MNKELGNTKIVLKLLKMALAQVAWPKCAWKFLCSINSMTFTQLIFSLIYLLYLTWLAQIFQEVLYIIKRYFVIHSIKNSGTGCAKINYALLTGHDKS